MLNTNTLALAKLVVNKRLNTLRLVVTFDTSANKITVRNASFVSGDLVCLDKATEEQINKEVLRALANAKAQLRTNNIQVVE